MPPAYLLQSLNVLIGSKYPPLCHCIFPSTGVGVESNHQVDELAADNMTFL